MRKGIDHPISLHRRPGIRTLYHRHSATYGIVHGATFSFNFSFSKSYQSIQLDRWLSRKNLIVRYFWGMNPVFPSSIDIPAIERNKADHQTISDIPMPCEKSAAVIEKENNFINCLKASRIRARKRAGLLGSGLKISIRTPECTYGATNNMPKVLRKSDASNPM